MNINLIRIASLCILLAACQNNNTSTNKENKDANGPFDLPDSLSTRRISFVLDLKQSVAQNTWSDFGTRHHEGALIYFNANQSEVFFPDALVNQQLNHCQKHSDDYCISKRTDSIPYHMEVMISFNEEDSTAFFYKNPVEQYSSVEEIGQYIPSVKSTEMWATMVIHEMFHHYQYNNKIYKEYAHKVISNLPFDSRNLVALCQEDKNFLRMIQEENNTLMKALAADTVLQKNTFISSYLEQRSQRIKEYGSKNPHLEQVENYYVLQEGSARYIEYKSMFVLKSYFENEAAPKVLHDPRFNDFLEFEEIDLEDDNFNYLVYAGSTDYHYTIGFNTMRLLDQLNVPYKQSLLDHPEKGLHQYLEAYLYAQAKP